MHTRYSAIEAYLTKDGSLIRELMHPAQHGNCQQSLAEAVIGPGVKTRLHKHVQTEELYHITRGTGLMTLAESQFEVGEGDTIAILPGTPHCIENTGNTELHILCSCSPPYSHADTQLLHEN